MLSLTASILETIIVRTSVFAGQQLLNVAYYGGMSLYNWYNPTMTETEILQQQVKLLQNELHDLKNFQYKSIESSIITFNNIEEIDDIDNDDCEKDDCEKDDCEKDEEKNN